MDCPAPRHSYAGLWPFEQTRSTELMDVRELVSSLARVPDRWSVNDVKGGLTQAVPDDVIS